MLECLQITSLQTCTYIYVYAHMLFYNPVLTVNMEIIKGQTYTDIKSTIVVRPEYLYLLVKYGRVLTSYGLCSLEGTATKNFATK